MSETLANTDVVLAQAHKMYSAWLALQGFAGTEIALEILDLMKPLPPPSPTFARLMAALIERHAAPDGLEEARAEITRLRAREALVREELRHWRAQLMADEPLLPRQVDAVLEQVAP